MKLADSRDLGFLLRPRRHAGTGPIFFVVAWILLLSRLAPAGAAESPPDTTDAGAATVHSAANEPVPLVIGNRLVFEFRANLLGYSPQARAKAASARIREAIRSHPRGDRGARVTTRDSDLGTLIQIDDKWVFIVTPGDVNPLAAETHAYLVEGARQNLEAAVTAALDQRTVSYMVRAIAFSLLATVIFGFLLRGLIWLMRWAGNRFELAAHARVDRLKLGPTPLVTQFRALSRVAFRVLALVVALGLTNVWATFVLKQFPYTYPWGDQLDDYLLGIGSTVGLAALHAVPNLMMLVVIYLVTRFVLRWIRLLFEAVQQGRLEFPGLDAETAVPAQRLVVLFVWLLALAVAFPYIPGSGGTAFKGLSVLFGLMVTLGSSNVMNQAASGYMLIFSRALRVNDFVRVGEYEGFVVSLGILSTKIRTLRDEEINVPNAVIVSSTSKNFTRLNRDKGMPLTTSVTIGYNTPWRQVHAMLLQAAEMTPGVRKTPEPRVLQTALSDFYVEYMLLVRLIEPEERGRVLSTLNANVQDVFNDYGVQIMSPHYESDPPAKVWVPKEKWHEAPAEEGKGRQTTQGH